MQGLIRYFDQYTDTRSNVLIICTDPMMVNECIRKYSFFILHFVYIIYIYRHEVRDIALIIDMPGVNRTINR